MVSFSNLAGMKNYIKLGNLSISATEGMLQDVILPRERVLQGTKSVRDAVIFTDKRIIAIDVQGMTGKKVEYISYPYKSITAFAIENAGVIDLDGELDLWVNGIGQVHFGFARNVDMKQLNQIIGGKVL